jgi:hypothetical protein
MTILPTMFVVLLGCVFPVQGWKVLVADGLAPTAMRVLSAGGVQTVEQHLPSKELAAGALADFDAVIIRSATTLSWNVLLFSVPVCPASVGPFPLVLCILLGLIGIGCFTL